MVCNHPARFVEHNHCGSVDMFLTDHLTSSFHMFEGCCEFMGKSSSYQVATLKIFVSHRFCGSRYITDLIFFVTL